MTRLALVLAFTAALAACADQPPSSPRNPLDAERAATVTILNSQGRGCCSGVSVLSNDGTPVIATAAHCVMHPIDPFDSESATFAMTGDAVWFMTWRGHVPQFGRIRTIDLDRDVAELVTTLDAPAPVGRALLCDACSVTVHAVSALYNALSYGEIDAQPIGFFWTSTISVQPGWSGSPVFVDGRVVGLIGACVMAEGVCFPRLSIIAGLP